MIYPLLFSATKLPSDIRITADRWGDSASVNREELKRQYANGFLISMSSQIKGELLEIFLPIYETFPDLTEDEKLVWKKIKTNSEDGDWFATNIGFYIHDTNITFRATGNLATGKSNILSLAELIHQDQDLDHFTTSLNQTLTALANRLKLAKSDLEDQDLDDFKENLKTFMLALNEAVHS